MFWVAVGFVWDCFSPVILFVSNNCLFLFLARSHSVFCKMVALLVAVILGAYKVNGDKLGSSN